MKLYMISADGGKSWTEQWLSADDVIVHLSAGYTVKEVVQPTQTEELDKVLLYYGCHSCCDGVWHAFELASYPDLIDDDAIGAKLAEELECAVDDCEFNYDCMVLKLPEATIQRIKAAAIKENLENQQAGCGFCLNGEHLHVYDKDGNLLDFKKCPMCGRDLGGDGV